MAKFSSTSVQPRATPRPATQEPVKLAPWPHSKAPLPELCHAFSTNEDTISIALDGQHWQDRIGPKLRDKLCEVVNHGAAALLDQLGQEPTGPLSLTWHYDEVVKAELHLRKCRMRLARCVNDGRRALVWRGKQDTELDRKYAAEELAHRKAIDLTYQRKVAAEAKAERNAQREKPESKSARKSWEKVCLPVWQTLMDADLIAPEDDDKLDMVDPDSEIGKAIRKRGRAWALTQD